MDTPKDISTLYRKMNINMNVLLAPIGLSSAKSMFLFCIYDHQQMSQAEICRELDMDKSTVAKMLVRLEKDHLVTKAVNPADSRSFIVTLTEKAISRIPQAKRIQENWLNTVSNDLTELEKRNFYELLEKVASAANKSMTTNIPPVHSPE